MWIKITLLVLFLLFMPMSVVKAEPIPPNYAYRFLEDSDYIPVFYSLSEPPLFLDRQFVEEMYPVIQCESSWRTDHIGLAGELGLLQIHKIHREEMASLGWDFNKERDRLQFGQYLWGKKGWRPWSCGYKTKKENE